jgi:hypothetical protein
MIYGGSPKLKFKRQPKRPSLLWQTLVVKVLRYGTNKEKGLACPT